MKQISFILVSPANPGNVGSAARAIKTMGFDSLRLVNPCDHLAKDARKLGYGSHDILESAKVFESLEDAISGLDLVIATTAKKRTVWNDYLTPEECLNLLGEKGNTIREIGIVFGREESGLTSDELELCDIRSSIPMIEPYPSVNLAQSVMIYAYQLASFSIKEENQVKMGKVNQTEQKVLKRKAQTLIEKLGISRNPNLSRRMIERLMLAGEDDMHLFLSFHQFLERYLEKK